MSDNADMNEPLPLPIPAPNCPQCAVLMKWIESLQAQLIAQRIEFEAKLAAMEAKYTAKIRELEAKINKHSGNSDIPPSANPPGAPKYPPKPPTGRKPGGQPGHKGHARERLPAERVNKVVQYIPAVCERCQNSLSPEPGANDPVPVWHQVADLPAIAAIVTEHQGHGRRCGCCNQLTFATIPGEIRAHGFGPKLAAAVAFITGRCHGSKRTAAEMVETLFGVPISLGSISNIEAEAAAILEPVYACVEQAVREAPVKNVDETGWKIKGKLRWLWLAATKVVACFKIATGRGQATFKEFMGENPIGTFGSDRWHAYNILDLINRQICWSHLKRDFQKFVDYGDNASMQLGTAGLIAVEKVFQLWHSFRDGKISRESLIIAMKPIQNELTANLKTGEASSEKRVAKFCKKILAIFPALWTFLTIEGVEPTNNHAERTLRLAVIWRKISFGNQSEGGCRFAERILSTVQTLRLQKRNVMDFLCQTFTAARTGQPIPSILQI